MKTIISVTTILLSQILSSNGFAPVTSGRHAPVAVFSTTEEQASPTAPKAAAPAAAAPVVAAAAPAAAAAAPATSAPGAPENNQSKYGVSLDLPETYVRCGRCATSFALKVEDLGNGKGRRVECSLCKHSWFQSRDRLFTLNDGHELVPLPKTELARIQSNIDKGRDPDFIGNAKFFVGNLDFGVNEDDLRELFSDIGEVGGASIVNGPDGRSRGFAFVTMMDDDVTEKCMALDGYELKGRNINVKPPNK